MGYDNNNNNNNICLKSNIQTSSVDYDVGCSAFICIVHDVFPPVTLAHVV